MVIKLQQDRLTEHTRFLAEIKTKQEHTMKTKPFDHFTVQYLIEDIPPLETIEAGKPIREALRKMLAKNYSQLPIVHCSTCIGAVTLESIARQLHKEGLRGKLDSSFMNSPVKKFVDNNARLVRLGDDVLGHVEWMAGNGFVIVRSNRDFARPRSIVTNYDLVLFFKEKTEVFLLLREIETSLRYLVSRCLKGEKLKKLLAKFRRGSHSSPTNIEDLTLGQLGKLILDNWSQFENIFMDKQVVKSQLSRIRRFRNQVFHFKGRPKVADLDSIRKLRRNYLNLANSQMNAQQDERSHKEIKDVFDQWLDEERRGTARGGYDIIFHDRSPFARLFQTNR